MKNPLRPPRRGEHQQPSCHKQPPSNHAPLGYDNPFIPHSDKKKTKNKINRKTWFYKKKKQKKNKKKTMPKQTYS